MKKKLIIVSICLFSILIIAVVATAITNRGGLFTKLSANTSTPSPTKVITHTPEPTDEPTPEPTATPEPMPQYTDIVVGFAGDIIAHEKVLDNSIHWDNGKKSYVFEPIFKYIKPALEYPDLMVANLESPIAGKQAGYSKYPSLTFNFPDEMVDAIKYSGIDMVLNANNHACDKNPEGLYRTLDMLDSADIMHTGAWRSLEEKAEPTVVDIKGIKVGIVSATYSLNGREAYISEDILEYLTCFIDRDQVKEQIDSCRENGAEIVIVSPHMGDEYQQYTREGIRAYGRAYIELGADVVIAHHPHVIQGSELIQVTLDDGTVREGVCFWSIGNFMSNQVTLSKDFAREVRETGVIVYVNIQKDNYSSDVKIKSLEYLPVWMLRRADLHPRIYAILPAGDKIDHALAPYNELPLSESNFRSLERAWVLATSQVGTEYAIPLSTIPVKEVEEDEIYGN